MSYWKKPGFRDKELDINNLDKEKVITVKKMAGLEELNIFFDRNKIIVALCDKLLEIWPDEK